MPGRYEQYILLLVRKPEGSDYLEDVAIDVIILKFIINV
jgi:hypothetical protein